jgi:hypothetical protein
MGEWRLDQVGRQFDEEPSPAPLSSDEAPAASAGGRPRPETAKGRAGNLGWLWLLLVAVMLGGAGGFGIWFAFLAPTPVPTVEPVLINADRSPTRIAPEDPGGMEVPHQERMVLEDFEDRGPPVEASVRPQPERPVPVARAELALPPVASAGESGESEPADPIADLIRRTEGDTLDEPAAPPAEPAAAPPAPADGAAAEADLAEAATAGEAVSPPAELTEIAGDEPASTPDTVAAAEPAAERDGAPVEVLLPRLPEEPQAAAASPAGETAEEFVAASGQPAAAPDTADIPAARDTRLAAAPAEPAALPQPEPRPAGPLTASVTGRDPASLDRAHGEDPFVDLLTALTWPSDRRHEPGRAAAAVPIGGAPADTPAASLEVAALADAVTAAPAPAATPAAAEPAQDAAEEAPSIRDSIAGPRFRPQPDGGYRVQIVAVRSQADAESEWRRFAGTYPDLLGGFEPYVGEVDLGERGVWLRVQAGPLDRADADGLCAALRERGADCIVRSR